MTAAPIFLICSERSGSNLMASIAGGHSRIYAHPPYHLGRDLLMQLHELRAPGDTSPAREALKQSAVSRITRYRGDAEAQRFADWYDARDVIVPAELARFVYQEMPLEAHGKHAFVKENNLHQLLFFLVDCFPDAKYVFQVRDPRDFLLSSIARRKRWLGNKFGSVRHAMQVWREDQLGGLAALGLLGPERVLLQRYEDLVRDFDNTVVRLCDFLGLDVEADMRKFHDAGQAQQLAVKGGPRENLAKPLMTDNYRKYRRGLSGGRIRIVEAFNGDLMDRFGYPREYRGLRRPGTASALRPQLSELAERLVNGELRAHYKSGNRRLKKQLDANVEPLCPPLWDD